MASAIQTAPGCMKDSFAEGFCKYFDGKLESEECLASLLHLGLVLDLDIHETECLHAHIRRLVMLRMCSEPVEGGYMPEMMVVLAGAQTGALDMARV